MPTFALALLLAVLGTARSSGAEVATGIEPAAWSDSGIRGPKYEQILADMDALRARYPHLVTVIDYGKSKEGRTLRLLVIMKEGRTDMEHPTLLMSGSTHGNEYLNIED